MSDLIPHRNPGALELDTGLRRYDDVNYGYDDVR